MAKAALSYLPKLRGAQMHSTAMMANDDFDTLQKLGIEATMGTYQASKLLKES